MSSPKVKLITAKWIEVLTDFLVVPTNAAFQPVGSGIEMAKSARSPWLKWLQEGITDLEKLNIKYGNICSRDVETVVENRRGLILAPVRIVDGDVTLQLEVELRETYRKALIHGHNNSAVSIAFTLLGKDHGFAIRNELFLLMHLLAYFFETLPSAARSFHPKTKIKNIYLVFESKEELHYAVDQIGEAEFCFDRKGATQKRKQLENQFYGNEIEPVYLTCMGEEVVSFFSESIKVHTQQSGSKRTAKRRERNIQTEKEVRQIHGQDESEKPKSVPLRRSEHLAHNVLPTSSTSAEHAEEEEADDEQEGMDYASGDSDYEPPQERHKRLKKERLALIRKQSKSKSPRARAAHGAEHAEIAPMPSSDHDIEVKDDPESIGDERRSRALEDDDRVYNPNAEYQQSHRKHQSKIKEQYPEVAEAERAAVRERVQHYRKRNATAPATHREPCLGLPRNWEGRYSLGRRDNICPFCHARHFAGLHVCCNKGRVWIDELRPLPHIISKHIEQRDNLFLYNSVRLNSMMSLASYQFDQMQSEPYGAQVAKTEGKVYHFPSCLYPQIGSKREMFGNYYIHGVQEATDLRMKSRLICKGINRKLIEELSLWFHANNPLAKYYKSMDELLQEEKRRGIPESTTRMKIVDKDEWRAAGGKFLQHEGTYRDKNDVRVSDEYVAIFFTADEDLNLLPRGLNVYQRLGRSIEKEILPWLPIVDPLCYPLFFPYGERGYASKKYPKVDPMLYELRVGQPLAKRRSMELESEESDEDEEQTVRTSDNIDIIRSCPIENELTRVDVPELDDDDIPLEQLKIRMVSRGGEWYPFQDGQKEEIPIVHGYVSDDSGGEENDDNLQLVRESLEDEQQRLYDEVVREAHEQQQIRGRDDTPTENNDTIDETNIIRPLLQDDIGEEDENESLDEEFLDEPTSSTAPPLRGRRRKFASQREFTLFRQQYRDDIHRYSSLRKLGQIYVIDVMTRIMRQRADFIRKHFTQTLVSDKKHLLENIQRGIDRHHGNRKVGAVTTIPASVPQSPRYMKKKFEEAVTIANALGEPDLFITFTGSVDWEEIQSCLSPGESWADHPMIVVEVFKKKLDAFLEDVLGKKIPNSSERKPGIFGAVEWYVYSVEFQQRGMPHIHLVVSLVDHISTPAEIDEIVWARLPEVPKNKNHPDYKNLAELRDLVDKYMIHRPCMGEPEEYCNKNKPPHYRTCKKRFPKEYSEATTLGDKHYPDYYRPNNGDFVIKYSKSKRVIKADNSYVVPYNPRLLLKYQSHINVEVISTVKVLTYLYKYIFKGTDRVITEAMQDVGLDGCIGQMTQTGNILHCKKLEVNVVNDIVVNARKFFQSQGINPKDEHGNDIVWYDEIIPFMDMKAMCAPEACWLLCGFDMNGCSHIVAMVPVHQPNEEPILFAPEEEEEAAERAQKPDFMSRLTAFFHLCSQDTEDALLARELTFSELPRFFKYNKGVWSHRKRDWSRRIIGRVTPVQPRFLQQFAIRLLSGQQKGPRSFTGLRTVDGIEHPDFVEAAKALRLMNDEKEWDDALNEARLYVNPPVLRRLFISILVWNCPPNGRQLWEKYREYLMNSERFHRGWTEQMREAQALYHIRSGLQVHGDNLAKFGLPEVNDRLLRDHKKELDDDDAEDSFTPNEHEIKGEALRQLLNLEQREVVETVLKAYEDRSEQRNFFINGAAGTGKTFVYKCLYHLLSAKLAKVICIAHTGIAANLLVQGMTVHRAFSIPISKDEKVICKVPFESPEAQRLKNVEIIIWDEATMSDKRILEAVNQWLMELHDQYNMPFGGVFTLLGGDWRQTLPIVAGGHDEEAVTHCIKNSTLWRFYQQFYLCTNIRASVDPEFASFMLDVGNGNNYEDKQRSLVRLPEEVMINTEVEVIDFVFENQQYNLKAAILTVDNRTANQINEKILKSLTGEQHTFRSIDKNDTDKNFKAMDPEFYHTMTPGGLPPHILNLKKGCNVILLRNMNVSLGLCNGTRMTVVLIAKDTVYCKPEKTQEATPEIVAIHRYTMSSTTTPRRECAFLRHQFPIRLCYAMTINKAQGQTLEKVGIILRTPVFSHGQLYVALSRVRTWKDIRVCNRVRGEDEDRALVTNKVLTKVFFMGMQDQYKLM